MRRTLFAPMTTELILGARVAEMRCVTGMDEIEPAGPCAVAVTMVRGPSTGGAMQVRVVDDIIWVLEHIKLSNRTCMVVPPKVL